MLQKSLAVVTMLLAASSSPLFGQQPKITWAPGFPKKLPDGTINLKGTYNLGSNYKLAEMQAEYFIIAKNGNDIQVDRRMDLDPDKDDPMTKGSFGNPNGQGFRPFSQGPWMVSIRIKMISNDNGNLYFLYSSYVEIK